MAEEKQYTLDELEQDLKQSHKDFIREYFINGWNRVKAYMKVYPDSSYQAAAVSANEILKNPKSKQFLNFLINDLEKTCNINKARNLIELAKIAYSNIAHLHDCWIELTDWEVIKSDNPDALSAIETIDTKTETKTYNKGEVSETDVEVKYVKISLYNKQSAISEINKMMGYNAAEKRELTGKNGESLFKDIKGITFDPE
jgi:hypothetical protein